MKQFNLSQSVFDAPIVHLGRDGEQNTYSTHGEGWYLIESQDEINLISASITGGGVVWEEDGKIKCSGKAPSQSHKFKDGQWVVCEETKNKIKTEQQSVMWERIKQKRYQNSLGGVYIESVKKWFQTGEEEKTKYLGLDRVIDKLKEIDWKCADNSFVKMNRALLNEIFVQMVTTENADHINAEKHRLAMLQAEEPLEYDFSSGWSANYE